MLKADIPPIGSVLRIVLTKTWHDYPCTARRQAFGRILLKILRVKDPLAGGHPALVPVPTCLWARDLRKLELELKMTIISLVTPCYNEQDGIAECYEAVRAVMEEDLPDYTYEHIFIDNCSSDRTLAVLRDLAAHDRRVKVIVNSRNFGPARSPFHAMLEAGGDVVIPVLADLQTPPALIPKMVALWEKGVKVVIAVKRGTDEHVFWRVARRTFYRLMKAVSKVQQIPNYMGYGLYDQCVVDALRTLNEPEPYFRGLIAEVGFEQAIVHYDQPKRRHGRSSYTIFSLADYALLGLSSYSRAPLRFMTLLGFSVSCLSFLSGLVYLFGKLLFWYSLPIGIAPVLIAIFFLSSVQLFALGLVGEYIGLLLNYTRRFPLVIEKERINFDKGQASPLRQVVVGPAPVLHGRQA